MVLVSRQCGTDVYGLSSGKLLKVHHSKNFPVKYEKVLNQTVPKHGKLIVNPNKVSNLNVGSNLKRYKSGYHSINVGTTTARYENDSEKHKKERDFVCLTAVFVVPGKCGMGKFGKLLHKK